MARTGHTEHPATRSGICAHKITAVISDNKKEEEKKRKRQRGVLIPLNVKAVTQTSVWHAEASPSIFSTHLPAPYSLEANTRTNNCVKNPIRPVVA
jgi:hypothetical protein